MFAYSHLQDGSKSPNPAHVDSDSPGWTADFGNTQIINSLTDEAPVQRDLDDISKEDLNMQIKPSNTNSPSKPDKVKYTPLVKTSVHQTSGDSTIINSDTEPIVLGSNVSINSKNSGFTRFHALICGLLASCIALVTFALIYVFVILPSHKGQILYPDGKMHLEDLARLRQLGENVVMTSCGPVRGQREQGVYSFKGIPYAEPPVGSRRWRSPVKLSYSSHTCWPDVLNVTSFGNKCVQPRLDDLDDIEGSEDCLYLNVWTPDLNPDQQLPVMVWIHSGDFLYGSGHEPGMSPGPDVAKETNAVYVSFNFRLGALGFLALEELWDKKAKTVGNYGLMDQLLVLNWVKDNIGHFGGDANRVTVFGHGSGASSIQALLSSHYATGLFHAAWISSPVPILNKTLGEAIKDNQKFKIKSGCREANCMRNLHPKQISASSPWKLDAYWSVDDLFQSHGTQLRNDLIIFDGNIVHFSKSNEGPYGPTVPVVFGTTHFEMSNLKDEKTLLQLTPDEYHDFIAHHMAPLGTAAIVEALRLYSHTPAIRYTSPSHFPAKTSAHLARLLSEVKNVCPLQIFAESFKLVHSDPTYFYVVELYPSHDFELSRNSSTAFVGWDMLAFFDGFRDLGFHAGQGDVNFKNIMREELMSLSKSGKPDAARWKPLPGNTGIIGRGVTVNAAPGNYFNRCSFWKKNGFFNYSWLT